jgi:SNF family Na+-dependent transporter
LSGINSTALRGLAGADPAAVRALYDAFLASPLRLLGYHFVFIAATATIVARGVGGGIEATFFDLLDQLTSNILLPIGGFAIAVFAGWAVPARLLREELQLRPAAARALRLALRYVAPAGIAFAALSSIFTWIGAAAAVS